MVPPISGSSRPTHRHSETRRWHQSVQRTRLCIGLDRRRTSSSRRMPSRSDIRAITDVQRSGVERNSRSSLVTISRGFRQTKPIRLGRRSNSTRSKAGSSRTAIPTHLCPRNGSSSRCGSILPRRNHSPQNSRSKIIGRERYPFPRMKRPAQRKFGSISEELHPGPITSSNCATMAK